MPFPFPTPQEASDARANANFFSRAGSTLLHNAPYGIGPLYNILSTVSHLAQGTAGQYGPPTSLVGRILNLFNTQTAPPPSTGVGGLQPPGGIPTLPNINTTPGQQDQQPQPPQAAPAAPGRTISIQDLLGNNRIWNALRPAFGVTAQQYNFPGSAIGPIQGLFNPYNPQAPQSPFFSLMGGNAPPAWARTNSNVVTSRNIP